MSGAYTTCGESRAVCRIRWGNLRERDHLEDPGIDGRIILRWIFRKWDVRERAGSMLLWIRTGSGHL
jgi:hypothetical protein